MGPVGRRATNGAVRLNEMQKNVQIGLLIEFSVAGDVNYSLKLKFKIETFSLQMMVFCIKNVKTIVRAINGYRQHLYSFAMENPLCFYTFHNSTFHWCLPNLNVKVFNIFCIL